MLRTVRADVVFQQDAVLQGLVPALDFALGLRRRHRECGSRSAMASTACRPALRGRCGSSPRLNIACGWLGGCRGQAARTVSQACWISVSCQLLRRVTMSPNFSAPQAASLVSQALMSESAGGCGRTGGGGMSGPKPHAKLRRVEERDRTRRCSRSSIVSTAGEGDGDDRRR